MSQAAVPEQRIAVQDDVPRIDQLMKASIRELFPRYYDDQQTASSVIYIGHVDEMLVVDGTYFVHEARDEVVACGGWSRRGKLYTGTDDQEGRDRLLDPAAEAAHVRAMFVRSDWTRRGLGRAILESSRLAASAEGFHMLDLMATLPGVPLYKSFGFVELERHVLTMPDGVSIEAVSMQRPVDLS